MYTTRNREYGATAFVGVEYVGRKCFVARMVYCTRANIACGV